MDRTEDSESKKDVSSPENSKKSEAATADDSSTNVPTATPLESKKDVSSPENSKKSEAATADDSSTNVPTATPLERPAEEIFASRWSSADELYASDKCCRNLWNDHELLEYLGTGQYGRVFLVKHRTTKTEIALKLCSMMRIGRGRDFATDEKAISDFKDPPAEFDRTEVEPVLERFRAERLVLRCLSGLCPFVLEIDERCSYTCVYDDVNGELGFPMRPDVGDLLTIWRELNDRVKEKDSRVVTDAVHTLLVFWAAQMADGLRFLHKCRIVHCDIWVRNYVMGTDGYIRLVDFGRYSVNLPNTPKSIEQANLSKRLANNDMLARLRLEELTGGIALSTRPSAAKKVGAGEDYLARKCDYFCVAKTLVMLGWPLNKRWFLEMRNIWHADALLKHCPPTSPIFKGDILDFFLQLSKHREGQLLDTHIPDNLIKHRLFREIDFEQLRAKALPAPIHPVLKDAIPLRPGWDSTLSSRRIRLQRQAVQAHESYCEGLSKEQKDFFQMKFLGWRASSSYTLSQVSNSCVSGFMSVVFLPGAEQSKPSRLEQLERAHVFSFKVSLSRCPAYVVGCVGVDSVAFCVLLYVFVRYPLLP